jgi:hypothetical protein
MNKNADANIISEIANLQAKIFQLNNLLVLAPYKDVNIFFYGTSTFLALTQDLLPFNLNIELNLLLTDSITCYEERIKDLETQLTLNV